VNKTAAAAQSADCIFLHAYSRTIILQLPVVSTNKTSYSIFNELA